MEEKKAAAGIFAAAEKKRVRSPEELDAYIRVVRPGTAVLIAALTLVLIGVLIWGFTGTLPVTEQYNGVIMTEAYLGGDDGDARVISFFVDASRHTGYDLIGKPIRVTLPGRGTYEATVYRVAPGALSKGELYSYFESDWIVDMCMTADYCLVMFGALEGVELDESYDLATAYLTLVTDNVRPIQLLLR